MKIKRTIKLTYNSFFDNEKIPMVYYDANTNWGDALNHYIFHKITGRSVKRVNPLFGKHYLGIGSILSAANSRSIVLGAGYISESSKVKESPSRIISVRGPKTRDLLLKQGISCPNVFGDCALAMPMVYFPKKNIKHKIGFIPHFKDAKNSVAKVFCSIDSVKYIDIMQSTESFINEILECEFIVSSSLHGLIAADAYGIPNVWVKISDNILGDDFKFHDYYESVNHFDVLPLALSDGISKLIDSCKVKASRSICESVYGIIVDEFK